MVKKVRRRREEEEEFLLRQHTLKQTDGTVLAVGRFTHRRVSKCEIIAFTCGLSWKSFCGILN